MREVLKVNLHNEERLYTELTLPAAPYTVLDALEKLGLRDGASYHWHIADKLQIKSLAAYMDLDGSIFELNALCQQLALLDDQQLTVVEGLAKMECTNAAPRVPLPRLIDMAYSTDRCHHVAEATNDYTLGRFCAENGFVPEADGLSDEAFELLDFTKIGREFRQNEGGVFTSGGYVQRHDELKQVYKTLDLTPKKPSYAMLAELPDGSRVKLPTPLGKTVVEEPARCVDCAAPALTGLTAMRSTLDLLALRLAELEVNDELTKYKAVLEATGCDDMTQALTLADELDQYAFNPELLEPDEVASGYLKELLPEEDLAALLPNVNLYRYGQKLMEQSGGKLTGYGYVQPSIGPVQDMGPQSDGVEMTLN